MRILCYDRYSLQANLLRKWLVCDSWKMEIPSTNVMHSKAEHIVNKYTDGETWLKSVTEGDIPFKNSPTEPPSKSQVTGEVGKPISKNPAEGEPLLKCLAEEEDKLKFQIAGEGTPNNHCRNGSNCEKLEDELERQAMEELLKEAKRGAERARDMGPVGWLKSSVPKTNKRFLNNTVVSTLKYIHSPPRNQVYKPDWNKHEEIYKSRSARSRNEDKLENFSIHSHQEPKEKSRSPRHRLRESRSPTHRQSQSPAHKPSKRKHKNNSKSHQSSDKKSKKSPESSSKSSSKKKSHKRSHKKSKKKSKKERDD